VDYNSNFFTSCLSVATQQEGNVSLTVSPTTAPLSDLDLSKDVPRDIPSQSYHGAVSDFYGLPTNPICIYRTGDEWPVPQGPEAQRVPREARPIFNHPRRCVAHAPHRSL